MERRVGKKEAKPGEAGGDGWGDWGWIAVVHENDGTRGSGEEFFFFWHEVAEDAGGGEVADHDGERLAVAMFAVAEAEDCGVVGGVDGEVESADTFDGENLAVGETDDGFVDGIVCGNGRAVGSD